MKNIINLSILNIKRNNKKIRIHVLIITIFIALISTLINISILLNECIRNIIVEGISVSIDYEIIVSVKYIINILIVFIILLTIIFIDILGKQSIDDRLYDIAICKSVGYKDKYIFLLLFYELYIITSISYLFSLIPSIICINIINMLFSKFNFNNSGVNVIYTYIVPLIIIYFIIFRSSYKALRKSKKIPISTLFNNQ